MNEFLREHGTELILFLFGSIAFTVLIISITIGTMNSNQHYYEAMKHCVDAFGTWIPNNNTGICLTTLVKE
jgi:hypothetical protein